MKVDSKRKQRLTRARKTHAKARLSENARLVVYRSNKAIYAQVMESGTYKILCGASNLKGKTGVDGAIEVGKEIAKQAKGKKIKEVTFDRNGYRYHGQIKALADSARKAGLEF